MTPQLAGRAAVAGLGIWVLRLATSVPFLDDEQRLEVMPTDDFRLSEKAEVFFSVLILSLTVGALLATWRLFRHNDGNPVQFGATIGAIMLATIAQIDLILAVGVGTRTVEGWFVNQLLDLTPILLVPIGVGVIVREHSTRPAQ